MVLDSKRAVLLFIQHRDMIPPSEVVGHLLGATEKCENRYFLHLFLHSLFNVDINAGKEFHDLQVELYADFDQQMLLPFLLSSQHYRLQKAYEICVKRDLHREQVFILGRMGNTKKALAVLINKLEDLVQAVEFASMQHDDELWQELIKQSVRKPEMVGMLLEHTVGNLDPLYIVSMVPNGLQIPRLRDRLVKIVTDYRTETSLRQGCNGILKTDCNLLVKYYKEARRAVYLSSIEETSGNIGGNTSNQDTESATRTKAMELETKTRGGGRCCLCFDPFSIQNVSVIVFFCCHAYHASCLMEGSDSINVDNSEVTRSDSDAEDGHSRGPRIRCVLCTTAAG